MQERQAARGGSDEAFARFRERSVMPQDTGVSILSRMPLSGATGNPASPVN